MYWNFSDNFQGVSLSDVWKMNGVKPLHTILPGTGGHGYATSDLADTETESVFSETVNINTAETYSLKILINTDHKFFRGKYGFRIYNSDKSNYIQCDIDLYNDPGEFDGSITINKNGDSEIFTFDYTGVSSIFSSDERGWLDMRVTGTTVKLYWRGELIVSETATKLADDYSTFSIVSTCADATYVCRVGLIEFNATILQNVGNPPPGGIEALTGYRTMLIASSEGKLYRELNYGELSRLSTSLTLRDDAILSAVQSGQKLYIADFGDLKVSGEDGAMATSQLSAASITDWTALAININDDVVVISEGAGGTTDGTYTIAAVYGDYITLASDPGNGTCSYRVERGPKVFDPIEDTLTLWTATSGQTPTGCPLVVRYLDRLVLAGADIAPHVWYMSAVSDPLDWDYSQTLVTSAVAGNSSNLGIPGYAITALVVNKDDYLIISNRQQLWLMRGDPGYGGSFSNISKNVGIIAPNAWCITPENQLVFLSTQGVYVLSIAEGSYGIEPFSRNVVPEELINLDIEAFHISFEYDFSNDGVHIFVVSKNYDARYHWYIDWPTKTFWKMKYSEDHEPFVMHNYQCAVSGHGGLLLGCRDGYLRHFRDDAVLDEDTNFESYVLCGPITLAQDGYLGKIVTIEGTIDGESSNVTWELMPGLTYQATVSASASSTGIWEDGLNVPVYAACLGQAFALKVSGDTESAWSFEDVIVSARDAGRRRKT